MSLLRSEHTHTYVYMYTHVNTQTHTRTLIPVPTHVHTHTRCRALHFYESRVAGFSNDFSTDSSPSQRAGGLAEVSAHPGSCAPVSSSGGRGVRVGAMQGQGLLTARHPALRPTWCSGWGVYACPRPAEPSPTQKAGPYPVLFLRGPVAGSWRGQ